MNGRRPPEGGVSESERLNLVTDGTIDEALRLGRSVLEPLVGPEAQREATFLLSGLLRSSPGQLLMDRERSMKQPLLAEYRRRLARRAGGEPLQYIEGGAAFRHLFLCVDRSVLIPRPESEQLVSLVLDWCEGKTGLRGMDLGTGSGAIAISLLTEGPFDGIVAVDISSKALNLAQQNAAAAGVAGALELRLGPFFEALRPDERFHVLVSNPPYVASGERNSLPAEVRDWEPPEALFAGPTGLEAIERIVRGAPSHLEAGGLLVLEVAPDLAGATVDLIGSVGLYGEPRLELDLAGHERIVMADLCTR